MKENIVLRISVLFLLCCINVFSLSACSRSDDDKSDRIIIGNAQKNISIPAEGATDTINFSTTSSWTAALDESNWITLNKNNGIEGKSSVVLIVDTNNSDIARIATITLTSGNISEKIKITQETSLKIMQPSDVPNLEKYYKPKEFENINMFRSDAKWSWFRSQQSEHFIVFWEKGFGSDPNADIVSDAYRVDINDLLEKAEEFYNENINILKFADVGSGVSYLDKYKMQIYLSYTKDWVAYGAGYDDVVGALWVGPSTVQPVGAVIAHEIGHSFQYQTYADLLYTHQTDNNFSRGFRYGYGGNGGNAFWEQCAQWQSFQSYPEEAFSSANFKIHMENYHRHFCHEDQRYASYWLHYYWADKHGYDFLGRLWRESVKPEDPIETYMRIYNLSVDGFNDEMYDAAAHLATFDIDAIRTIGTNYIGKYTYQFYQLNDGSYQVAYSKCPSTTGYNIIPLNVPDAGTEITTTFTGLVPGASLAENDPGEYTKSGKTYTTTNYNAGATTSGWRYGYVALLEDGTRIYGDMNKATSAGATTDVSFTVPDGCKRLWFVVLGAPSAYESLPWDEDESLDPQWPYKVKFTNTDLLGNILIPEGAKPTNLTLTYEVSLAADASAYSGTTIDLDDNGDLSKVALALTMQRTDIVNNFLKESASPSEGKIALVAVESDGKYSCNTTANGYGYWFDRNGDVVSWGDDSIIFTEFNTNNLSLKIGQYPGKCTPGDKFTIKEGWVYTKDGTQYLITFVFNITIT